MSRLRLTLLVLAGALLAWPDAGRAAVVRTVCASGCDYSTIDQAIDQVNAGDFIEVKPGTYIEQVVVTVPLHIFAPADGPRPVVSWAGGGATTLVIGEQAAGTTVDHLDIRATGQASAALAAYGAVKATDLALAATAVCAELIGLAPSQLGPGVTATSSSTSDSPCIDAGFHAADIVTGVTVNAPDTLGVNFSRFASLTDSTVNAQEALDIVGGTVRRTTLNGAGVGLRALSGMPTLVSDSVVTSREDGGIAVLASGGPGGPVVLRNVTAVADGSSSTGLGALGQPGPGLTAAAIDARNVIARGTANGASGEPAIPVGCGGPCAPGVVTLGYSNVNDPGGVVDTTTVGHNQSSDPVLVNPVVGPGQDFHIASADSPVIGAGARDASDGPSDRDGIAHPDPPTIGAYEYTGPPAPVPINQTPAGSTGGGGTASNPSGGDGDRRPTISRLAETNAVFAVARMSTPLQGSTAAASRKRGTLFSFWLDQSATVTIVITASANCRRTRAARGRNPRCYRTVARLTRTAHAGLNRLPFSGRVRGRQLHPGGYRAAFAATSAGGSSDPRTLGFRIVGR